MKLIDTDWLVNGRPSRPYAVAEVCNDQVVVLDTPASGGGPFPPKRSRAEWREVARLIAAAPKLLRLVVGLSRSECTCSDLVLDGEEDGYVCDSCQAAQLVREVVDG